MNSSDDLPTPTYFDAENYMFLISNFGGATQVRVRHDRQGGSTGMALRRRDTASISTQGGVNAWNKTTVQRGGVSGMTRHTAHCARQIEPRMFWGSAVMSRSPRRAIGDLRGTRKMLVGLTTCLF